MTSASMKKNRSRLQNKGFPRNTVHIFVRLTSCAIQSGRGMGPYARDRCIETTTMETTMMIWVSVVGVRDTTCPLRFVAKLATRGWCEQIDRFCVSWPYAAYRPMSCGVAQAQYVTDSNNRPMFRVRLVGVCGTKCPLRFVGVHSCWCSDPSEPKTRPCVACERPTHRQYSSPHWYRHM